MPSEPLVVCTSEARRGLSLSGALSLCAVVAVLVVVSIPRLCGIALQENEADARSTAQLLAQKLAAVPWDADRPPPVGEVLRRSGLAPVLTDAELLAGGKLLRRHGYLFELTWLPMSLSVACAPLVLPSGAASEIGTRRGVRAWPWKHGATGCSTFLATEGGAILVNGNAGGRWDGPQAAGFGCLGSEGWTRIP